MKAKVLDSFKENESFCYLASIKLAEYIENLPKDYHNYEVQREIVKNSYLDDLISTILQGKHIPPIVLVVEDKIKINNDGFLEIDDFKILDGLQRTFRLQTIYKTIQLLKEELKKNNNILNISKLQLSKSYKEALDEFNSSSFILSKIIEYYKTNFNINLEELDVFFDRYQWFEIWVGLTPDDEVNKMLILNAGHKAVKTKHQLELLFRNIIPILKKIDFDDFTIVREKDINSTQYSKDRKIGEYHFSHLITSLLSFGPGRPLTTNIDLIQKSQSNFFKGEIFENVLQLEFLKEFIRVLLKLDEALFVAYNNEGTRWIGRETSLVGIFAATGKYLIENEVQPIQALYRLNEKVIENPSTLNINDFEDKRNSLDLAKINIGNVNKKAVYNGVYDILVDKANSISWASYFKIGE